MPTSIGGILLKLTRYGSTLLIQCSSLHVSTVRQDRALLLYALVKGFELDVGRIIKESVLDYVENNFSGNTPTPPCHPLMYQRGDKSGKI